MMHRGTVTLETERLILRHFRISDAEAMFRNWAGDPDVVRFMPYELCVTIKDARNKIDEWIQYFNKAAPNSWELFAIELKSNGEIIGTIDFAETDSEARSAEVGYQLGKAWWGKGYAAEALRVLLRYCFETVKLHRVWANHNVLNPNSGKVMEKAGMLYEGILRKCKIRRGELVSSVYYAILAEDYFSDANPAKFAAPQYVRIQTRDIAYMTGKPRGIFASVHRLMDAGKLTDDEIKQFNYIDHEWFQHELPNPPFYGDDTPGKPVTWFKTAATAHMLDMLQPLMDMLDRNNVPYDVVYTNAPGRIVYEDTWQVAVAD